MSGKFLRSILRKRMNGADVMHIVQSLPPDKFDPNNTLPFQDYNIKGKI